MLLNVVTLYLGLTLTDPVKLQATRFASTQKFYSGINYNRVKLICYLFSHSIWSQMHSLILNNTDFPTQTLP